MFKTIENYFLFRQIFGALIFLSKIDPKLKIAIILFISVFGKQLFYSGNETDKNHISLLLKVNSIVAYLQILIIIIDNNMLDKLKIQILIFALGMFTQHKLQKLL